MLSARGTTAAGSSRAIRHSLQKPTAFLIFTKKSGRVSPSRTTNSSCLPMSVTSIQARNRKSPTLPTRPGIAIKVEHEYKRCGAWAYFAALDVHRAKVFGRCEPKSGIAPFDRLVAQVMAQPPYKQARRVYWILDNGSSHRGTRCVKRLTEKYPRVVAIHGPVHASWLNQIEIYFSILQRKALTPNDFPSLKALEEQLIGFQSYYEKIAKPFEWKFTRRDLAALLDKMHNAPGLSRKAAA